MLGLDMLDMVLGLVFLYLLMSLISSAAVEFFEAVLRFRARDLEHGMHELLGNDRALVKKIYDHPLVASLYAGSYGIVTTAEAAKNDAPKQVANDQTPPNPIPITGASMRARWRKRQLPSYVPARNFALALLDIIAGPNAIAGTVPPSVPIAPAATTMVPRQTITLPDTVHSSETPASQAVAKLVLAAGNDAAKARENIEEWFNSSMDRVSGWFKRRTQYILLFTGLISAVLFNIDSIAIAKVLATNKILRQQVVHSALTYKETHPQEVGGAAPKATGADATIDTAGGRIGVPVQANALTVAAGPQDDPKDGRGVNGPTSDQKSIQTLGSKEEDVAAREMQILSSQIAELNKSGLPIGWNNEFLPWPDWWFEWILKALGISMTACAVSLGAPFWFDLLNKIIVVRSTVKPKEKSGIEGAKDPQA